MSRRATWRRGPSDVGSSCRAVCQRLAFGSSAELLLWLPTGREGRPGVTFAPWRIRRTTPTFSCCRFGASSVTGAGTTLESGGASTSVTTSRPSRRRTARGARSASSVTEGGTNRLRDSLVPSANRLELFVVLVPAVRVSVSALDRRQTVGALHSLTASELHHAADSTGCVHCPADVSTTKVAW